MSRAVVLVAAALIFAAFARPAEAGWKNTRWDMSPAEFRALYPQATRLPPLNVNETWEAWFEIPDVEHEGRVWRTAKFEFRNNQLKSVSLSTSDQIQGPLVSELRARLGAPRLDVTDWVYWCVRGEGVSVHWSVAHPEYGTWVNYSAC